MALTAPQTLFLVLGGAMLAGYAAHRAFQRWRISDISILLGIGLLVGPIFGLVDPSILSSAIPFLSPIALMIVLFEGGLDLSWEDVRDHAGRALVMTIICWTLTAGLVAVAAHAALGLSWQLGLLFGACVAATGMLVVIPLLQALRAPPHARVVLTVETALGDLLSAVVVTAASGMIVLHASAWDGALLFGRKFLIGAALGIVAGLVWSRVLHGLTADKHGWPVTLGALLLSYVAAELLGGSGFLMALAFGLFVGNAKSLVKLGGLRALAPLTQTMRWQQGEAIFVLRSLYFVFLGISVKRSLLTPASALAAAALLAAIVAARVIAVMLVARKDRGLLVSMMPRGRATAVIASLPFALGVPGTEGFLMDAFLVIVAADLATTVALMVWQRRKVPAPAADISLVPH